MNDKPLISRQAIVQAIKDMLFFGFLAIIPIVCLVLTWFVLYHGRT
jgi:hypothetical protein